jgi:sulfate adenylyltransferase
MDRHGMQTFTYAKLIRTEDDGLVAPYGGELVQAFVPAHDRPAVLDRLSTLPTLHISADELLDMEMIACGALSPLTGFMTRAAYERVLTNVLLPDGRPWGLPVTLAVTRAVALSIRPGQEVALYHGADPVGVMRVEELFPWDAEAETRALGAASNHACTDARRARQAEYLAGGPVALLAARGAGFMQHRHLWPLEMRGQIMQRGWRQVAVPHLKHPWRRTHEYLLKCALEASDALLLHTPADMASTPQAIPPEILQVASCMMIENYFPVDRISENPIPSALFAPHARTALMHAILSQNYGASQFFLTEEDATARDLFTVAARHGLAIRPVFMPAAFHCEPCSGIATHKSCPHDAEQRLDVTDREIAERLLQGEGLPSFIARPEIARSLARGMAERLDSVAVKSTGRHIYPHAAEVSSELRQSLAGHKACALWMTGLSGSGKSTIASRLERELLLGGHRVFVLDGDTLRHGLNHDLGFSEADRRENLRRAAEVVKVMVDAGMIVIASFISPFRAERQMVREILGPSFREVYVEASLAACEERDPKGLYKRARAGQIPQFTGISSPYEAPESPDVRLDTTASSVDECTRQMRDYLATSGLLRSARDDRRVTGSAIASGRGGIRIQ